MPESRLWVDSTAQGVTLTLQLPLNRLEFAYGQPLVDSPGTVLAQQSDGLARYLLAHIGARSGQQGWQVLRPRLAVVGNDASAELEAVIELRAPAGSDARSFTLLYDAITHEVRTHRALVYLRNDWAAGQVAEAGQSGQAPLLLGEFGPAQNSLPVVLGRERAGASFVALFKRGAGHIAEGIDHLLFLLTLLLAAPLTAAGGRWLGVRRPWPAVKQLAAVVTAFTVGHTLTLALGSTGLLALPTAWVEVAVAASIIVAAAHAWRPLLKQGELLMAGGFGLLHGLAFAISLSGAGLSWSQRGQALLAFNLGIEAMQLLLVLGVVPPLLLLAQLAPRGYAALRNGVAAIAAVAATLWVTQRLGWEPVLGFELIDSASTLWIPAVTALWLAATLVWVRRRLQAVSISPISTLD
ncbi:HupE/UreJ family protein [Roseateles oligotrophus]|uniref:HupE/UreJ family protein n=1 Tax=Roseateles oligotrophus TaxID=1769250 RepID=A0ABT2YHW4_9BURK|nr:HupE/UreJ family protein [Roseateles oligotrophus]MCV2369597.1 HupE/UreJ family protein [Roseateles oligotrophus]